MGYPYGQSGHDPYAAQGYAQPAYDPYTGQPLQGAQPYGAHNAYPAPAYGAAPYPYAQGYPQQRAGGGTAITAAVITLLLSLLGLAGLGISAAIVFGSTSSSASDTELREIMIPIMAVSTVPCLLMFLGSILLFKRKTAGRVIIILMMMLSVGYTAISTLVTLKNSDSGAVGVGIGSAVVVGALPLLILLLAAAPSTGRWIREGRQPTHPYY
ncbi:hypothetical protein [Nocardia lasii]|uniref:DUF805 domain-containing protein n=1 Tax=Nocardia lasii TaxID=1616107 RepID=A0ABW1JSR0_9NOCA